MGKIKQYFKDIMRTTSIISISILLSVGFFIAFAAISWPSSTPAGETNGGAIMSYINNMLTSDCGSGEAMYGFNANGTKKCRAFSTGPAITYSWNTTGWSSCSVSCGGGNQTRTVTCKGSDGSTGVDSSCTGTKPAATQSCNTSACSVPVTVINGSCGTAQGQSYSTSPATNLCSQGTQSTVTTGTTTYNWTCVGSNGGTTANCSANRTINGACGIAQSQVYIASPITNLCSQGTQSTVTTGATTYTWTCAGINGGTTANCSANIGGKNLKCSVNKYHNALQWGAQNVGWGPGSLVPVADGSTVLYMGTFLIKANGDMYTSGGTHKECCSSNSLNISSVLVCTSAELVSGNCNNKIIIPRALSQGGDDEMRLVYGKLSADGSTLTIKLSATAYGWGGPFNSPEYTLSCIP